MLEKLMVLRINTLDLRPNNPLEKPFSVINSLETQIRNTCIKKLFRNRDKKNVFDLISKRKNPQCFL